MRLLRGALRPLGFPGLPGLPFLFPVVVILCWLGFDWVGVERARGWEVGGVGFRGVVGVVVVGGRAVDGPEEGRSWGAAVYWPGNCLPGCRPYRSSEPGPFLGTAGRRFWDLSIASSCRFLRLRSLFLAVFRVFAS